MKSWNAWSSGWREFGGRTRTNERNSRNTVLCGWTKGKAMRCTYRGRGVRGDTSSDYVPTHFEPHCDHRKPGRRVRFDSHRYPALVDRCRTRAVDVGLGDE